VSSVLYFRADHAINQVDETATAGSGGPQRTFVNRNLERPALSAEETVARIESCNAWMQLRDVGVDPEYRELLHTIMAELAAHAGATTPGITDVRADIFVSSPGATTPFHLDEEHNFLLQVRGSKRLSIADGSDRQVLSEAQLADFYRGNGELAAYAPQLEERSVHVELGPGEGVHIPPCHPHWVKNGDAVSISFGILWQSDVTAAKRQLYRTNDWLRGIGLRPRSPGAIPQIDALKVAPFRLKRLATRALKEQWSRIVG
jgi:Cupin-like domain